MTTDAAALSTPEVTATARIIRADGTEETVEGLELEEQPPALQPFLCGGCGAWWASLTPPSYCPGCGDELAPPTDLPRS